MNNIVNCVLYMYSHCYYYVCSVVIPISWFIQGVVSCDLARKFRQHSTHQVNNNHTLLTLFLIPPTKRNLFHTYNPCTPFTSRIIETFNSLAITLFCFYGNHFGKIEMHRLLLFCTYYILYLTFHQTFI